jgi:hypothetical protein
MFVSALTEVYNIDPSFATTLASNALDNLPHAEAGPNALNLEHLNKHDAIEHDASLSRNDAIQGDNHSVQPKLVQALLDDAEGEFLTVGSLAKTRARREAESAKAGSPSLGVKMQTIANGEAALILQVLGHLGTSKGDYQIPKKAAKQWLEEERLPDGWKRPETVISFASTTGLAARVVAAKTLGNIADGAKGILAGFTDVLGLTDSKRVVLGMVH